MQNLQVNLYISANICTAKQAADLFARTLHPSRCQVKLGAGPVIRKPEKLVYKIRDRTACTKFSDPEILNLNNGGTEDDNGVDFRAISTHPSAPPKAGGETTQLSKA